MIKGVDMEGMKHYGWSLVDSTGIPVTCLIFKNEWAASHFKNEMASLHPERECGLIELFVKEEKND